MAFPVRVLVRLALAVLAATGASAPSTVFAQPTAPGTALSFDLADQFGARWRSEQLAGRALVLVLGSRAHADRMKPWSDSLQRVLAADTATVRWFMVADLRSIPSFMRRLASQRAPREPHRILLLDADGTISTQLAADRKAMTVVVLDRDRRVRLRLSDVAPTSDQLRVVRDMVIQR